MSVKNKEIKIPLKTKKYTTISDDMVVMFGRKKVRFYSKKKAMGKKIINGVVGFLAPIIIITGILTAPIVKSKITSWIKEMQINRRPEIKNQPDSIPPLPFYTETVNPADLFENEFQYLKLSETAMSSVSFLNERLNQYLLKYTHPTVQSTTPVLIIEHSENNILKSFDLICDIDDKNSITLNYKIENSEDFKDLLYSPYMETPDIINGVNNFLSSINLTDIPSINKKITINDTVYYTTEVLEKTESTTYNEETESYNIERFYAFNLFFIKDGTVCQKTARIKKNIATSNPNFDSDNLSCLYDIYKTHSDKFESESEIELGMNRLSLIFISAKKQKLQEESFEL